MDVHSKLEDSMRLGPLEEYRVAPGLDAFRIRAFAQNVLGFCPSSLQHNLEAQYPTRGAGDALTWAEPQWVEGDNDALKYTLPP